MAPKAPIGARRMIKPTTAKSPSETIARTSTSALTRSPSPNSARPNSTENRRTCRTSPRAKAPTIVSGMTFSRKSIVLRCWAPVVYAETELRSAVAGLNPTPSPGFRIDTTTSPMTSAIVETISKYRRARSPIRPTSRIAPMCAMPTTTVVNTIGAIIIFTSLMNPSPSGRIAAAFSGATNPKNTPIAIATSTCTYRLEYIRPLAMRVIILTERSPLTWFPISLLVSLLIAAIGVVVLFRAPSGPRSLKAFDPDRIADLEVDMWQAYYRKENVRLFHDLIVTLHEQYHYSWAQA